MFGTNFDEYVRRGRRMKSKNSNEADLDALIQEFQMKFGILDEGQIVDDDDCEKSLSMDYEDLNLRRA